MKHRTVEEQKRIDDARLLHAWKKFHREERAAAIAGPHGAVLAELFRMLDHLKHVKPAQLLGLVMSIDWASIDYGIRLVVVHEVNTRIAKIRETNNLPPFDDGLPGDPDGPSRTIRKIVLTACPHNEGAHRGAARPTITSNQRTDKHDTQSAYTAPRRRSPQSASSRHRRQMD
jgi:hypothetical protein